VILQVDPSSPVPPYEQIRTQIATMIAGGVLHEGQRLPTIRQLAADLGLAGGTVARAYRELEREGLVVSRRRRGTTVTGNGAATRPDRAQRIMEAARAFVLQARQLGVDPTEALDAALKTLESSRPAPP
jgi:GntR family transcriptional regulator